MKSIWMIIFLTLIWCGFSNNFELANIILGVCISMICCFLLPEKRDRYHIRPWSLVSLLIFILVELIKSSALVAWDVITPKNLSEPKILDIDLTCKHDMEITLLSSLISLTPGTLTIDLSDDKKQLKIHAMFAANPVNTIDFIKNRLEPKVLKVFSYENN